MKLFGDLQGGVLFSSCIQAVIVAAILSWTLKLLNGMGMGKRGIAFATLFFALDPIIALLCFSSTKDTLFSAFLVAYCVVVAKALFPGTDQNAATSRPSGSSFASMLVLAFLVCSLRHNAIPAMALSTAASMPSCI